MRYGSVCSGIEAATVAWHPLGWEPAFFSEIEKFPRAVLQHHYPDTPLHGDFTTIQEQQYGPIDLLVGGTPCQSFSVAGLRKGLDDDRGNLALEFLRLSKRERPRWVVWENVPGVLSSNGGRDFGAFLGALVELGYGFAYRVLDAQYFGLAQRRKRVFVVGYFGDWRRAAAVLFERESLSGNPAPRREKGEVAPTIPSRSTGGGGLGTDFDCDGGLRVTHTLKGEGFDASEDGTGRGTPIVPVHVLSSGQANAELSEELSPTLNCNRDGAPIAFHHTQDPISGDVCHSLGANANATAAVALNLRGREGGAQIEVSDNGICTALRAADGGSTQPMTMQNMQVRRLTPVECERLQGFPDGYTAIPWRGKDASECPDGPRYKALGNSMAVPVMRWIGERIQSVDDLSLDLAENELVDVVVGIN